MEEIIKTVGLTKRYGKKTVVSDVNMTVYRGDIYGFIGKNGAGKTTAMKLILGLAVPSGGEITLFGDNDLNKGRRKIGSLIEAPGLFRTCTAYENMKRFSLLSGGDDEKIKELLELVGLADTGKKRAGKFSLGMKQRLGIAIALLGDPEALILDEPINGLDPEGIKEVRDCVLKLNREKGVTFLISSHLLDELSKIVTRYGIINDGVLIEEITADELQKRIESGLKVVVDDGEKAEKILLENGFAAEQIKRDGNVILLPVETKPSSVNSLLAAGGVSVEELTTLHGDVEQYFIDRTGV